MFNNLFRKAYFPIGFKYFFLLMFLILIIIGFSAHSTDNEILIQLRNTNLANLLVWSYWWPTIIILSVFLGRIWCMVCPVEIVTSFFAKIGFKRRRPKFLLSGWGITIFYILILFVGIQGFAVHRGPTFMAVYLLAILGVSVIIALYEKNTFCRYLCPIGHLLGLYSKLSFLGWRVKDKSVCAGCKDKSCIDKKYRYNMNYKSCGVDLYPASIDDNSNCILCAGCLKTCDRYRSETETKRPNPQPVRTGFAQDLLSLKVLKTAEAAFLFIVSGFVIYENPVGMGCYEKNINAVSEPSSGNALCRAPYSIRAYQIKHLICYCACPYLVAAFSDFQNVSFCNKS